LHGEVEVVRFKSGPWQVAENRKGETGPVIVT